jgi:hypothetical protein
VKGLWLAFALVAISCEDSSQFSMKDQDGGSCEMTCMMDMGINIATPADLKCASSASCANATPICAGSCRQCSSSTDDTECQVHNAATPRCDSSSGACVACRVDTVQSDCMIATAPICGTNNTCRACQAGDDSACATRSSNATPKCDTGSGKCVQCILNSDCSGTTPICGADRACHPCKAHSECPGFGNWPEGDASSGICVLDGASAGSCVTMGQIAYVDSRSATITVCKAAHPTATGAVADPFCDVQDAIASPQPIVLVRTSTQPYGGGATGGTAVNISRSVTLVGPGGQAANKAKITGLGSPVVTVGGTATVVIDGFEVATTTVDGIFCSNGVAGTNLTIRRSNIHNAGGIGINSSTCAIVIDGNLVGPTNGGGGIKLVSSKYTVTNNLVFNNGAGVPGVNIIDSPAGSIFAFNTVAGNSSGAFPGGVTCPSAATAVIQNSIVATNSTTGGTQFAGMCQFQNVVVGRDSTGASGVIKKTPAFTADYHLDMTTVPNQTANADCCIDKLGTPGTPGADHDVDFTARPKGSAVTPYDIGGQEVQ